MQGWRGPAKFGRTPDALGMSSFFRELKRRNVYKVAVAYAVVAWLLIQLASILFPTFEAPPWVMKVFIAAVALGFPFALIIAWAFELTPEGLKRTEDVTAADTAAPRSGRAFAVFIGMIALVAAGISLLQFTDWRLIGERGGRTTADKSIAVLPFENLSRDPDNAYFADGMQDEILTRLAKIADLKVISRTSTQRYKSSPANIPEIAKQLGVAHILEGSVQKSGEQVRVTVQLIHAATDSHVWAETYDRKLTDIFAVESEIAENIARTLRAQLTGNEQQAVAAKPTENSEAYEAYLRGLALWNTLSTSAEDYHKTVLYFDRAVQLDPKFAVAWASLSVAHTMIYAELDQTPQQLARAKSALDSAVRLQPDASETHFAHGMYLYRGLRDYEGALLALQKAHARSPNQVAPIEFTSYVKRRQGKWDEALALQREALELDPRNAILLSETALTYRAVRNFKEAQALIERGLELEPNDPRLLLQLAETYVAQGNTEVAGKLLARVPVEGQNVVFSGAHIRHAIFLRRYPEAIRLLRNAVDAHEFVPKSWAAGFRVWLGICESLSGNGEAAKATLLEGRRELEQLRAEGDKAPRIATHLLLACSFLGDTACVKREAEVLESEIERDAVGGPDLAQAVAMGRAQLGQIDAVVTSLSELLKTPAETSLTPALLRLDPVWDPVRSDPSFQKLSEAEPRRAD